MACSYKWSYRTSEFKKDVFEEIKAVTGSGIIANLLINRGVTCPKEALAFLSPDDAELSSPYVFPDMQKAVDRINRAVETQEHIVIYGDFDADGVTSTSLLYKTLKFLNANVGYYIPGRADEGHGLNRGSVCHLISKKQAKLIITVDCGISNPAEIKLANSFGADVIITDHHEPLEIVPEAHAIINPKMLEQDDFGLKYLAGVGVAYKLAEALLESNNKKEFTEDILHLVAIGTVGDVVPLLAENRTLVYRGLNIINRKKPVSVAKLIELTGKKQEKKVTSGTIAFGLVPRINALGRLAEANPAVEFLVTDDENRLNELANELDITNKARQDIGEDTFKQAMEKINLGEIDLEKDKAIILAAPDWHAGIIGIVASKLVETYYRPVLLISIDEEAREARCSARSIEGLNLFETLSHFQDYFTQFGGHALAAGFGFSLETISYEDLKRKILSYINQNIDSDKLKPELKIDMDIESIDLTPDFIRELDRLAPYGELNPYPIFSISNLVLKGSNAMGKKKNHLKVLLSDDYENNLEAVWWQKSSLDIPSYERVSVAFTPSINTYMDQEKVQLILKDLKRTNEEGNKETEICESIEETKDLCINDLQINYNSDVNWHDHRQEKGFKKEFLQYLNSLGDEVKIFAESQRSKEILENIPFLKANAVDRLTVKNADHLVFLDFPSDETSFMNVFQKADPKEIHLFGLIPALDPVELIKTISGMLRYAAKEKDGLIQLDQSAAFLAISQDLLLACVELLDIAGVIEIAEITEDIIRFKFAGSVNLNSILQLDEYRNFLNSLQEFEDYKQEYKNKDIELIKQTLDNYCSLLSV